MRIDQSSMDLSTLVDKVRSGDIDLQPDFQRGEVWAESKKQRLIDTVLRNWYIPAIHIVVNDDLDREEILDGQQRLRTIIDFMDDKFPINGAIEPTDENIVSLHGARYSQLSPSVRSRFRRFTFTTIRLRDYESEEPGELFFRLNQLTALTSAEQRNALIGRPRNQIKKVVTDLSRQLNGLTLGFSNARMNYDDTIARLAVAVETGSLTEKITASSLERRYRSGRSFPQSVMKPISSAVNAVCNLVRQQRAPIKLNRASLFSWLFFHIDRGFSASEPLERSFAEFFFSFEYSRGSSMRAPTELPWLEELEARGRPDGFDQVLVIYNDRASSRVNDVNSVLLRDLCLACGYSMLAPSIPRTLSSLQGRYVKKAIDALNSFPTDVSERSQAESYLAKQWEQARAAR